MYVKSVWVGRCEESCRCCCAWIKLLGKEELDSFILGVAPWQRCTERPL